MALPSVQILGVYSPRENAADFQAFLDAVVDLQAREDEIVDMPEAVAEMRQDIERELGNAVLIEALVTDPDDAFSVDAFVHPDPDRPEDNWQVAWCGKYLTPDGNRLLGECHFDEVPSEPCFRVVFYIHYWKHANGLTGPYGALELPPVQPLPQRLWQLAPYEQVG